MMPFELLHLFGLASNVSFSFSAWCVGGMVSFMIINNPLIIRIKPF
jgi:hypothetical protein